MLVAVCVAVLLAVGDGVFVCVVVDVDEVKGDEVDGSEGVSVKLLVSVAVGKERNVGNASVGWQAETSMSTIIDQMVILNVDIHNPSPIGKIEISHKL